MDMNEPRVTVAVLERRLAAAWREAGRADRTLSSLRAELRTAHHRLAGLASARPQVDRYRRDHLEALQSAVTEIEAEVERSRVAVEARHALATRQLAAAHELFQQWARQRVEQFDCFRSPFIVALLAAEVGAFAPLFLCMAIDRIDLFLFLAFGQSGLLFGAVLTHVMRCEFDGRWLRVTSRFLGFEFGKPRVVDLAGREVHLETEEVVHDEGSCTIATVIVRPAGNPRHSSDEVPLCLNSELRESKRLASQVEAWCAIARLP